MFLFVLIFSMSYIWQAIVPVGSEAPDEGQHIQMIYFLKNNRRIPVFDREKDIFKTFFFKTGLYGGVYYSMAYNSPLSYLPFVPFAQGKTDSGGKTVVLPLRLISGLFIGLFSVFLFLALFNFNRRKFFSALGVSLFISLIPQLIFTSAYVNIEPIALFLSALSLYFLSLIFLQPKPANYLFLGISLGFLALCKANYLIVVCYLGVIALWQLFRAITTVRQKIINFMLIGLPIFALNYWWWVRNIKLYHDPLIINHISTPIKSSSPAWFITPSEAGVNFFNIFNFNNFNLYVFSGFYAYLGAVRILLPLFFYWAFYIALVVLALVGLWSIIRKNRRDLPLFLFSVFMIILDFAIFINKNLTDFSPQGRHLFPLLIPLALILILGLKNWPGKLKEYFLSSMVIINFVASLLGLFKIISGYFVTGLTWVIQTDWANKIAWVFTFSTDSANKIVPDFTFHKFTLENYQRLYLVVYNENPRYSIYFSLLCVILFIFSSIMLARLLFANRNEKISRPDMVN